MSSKRIYIIEEHKRGQNFAHNNSRWNFTEVILSANKLIPENLVVVRELWEIRLYKPTNEPTTEKRWAVAAVLDGRFMEVNFSKLMHNNQTFRNDVVCNHYHLCKLFAQTIECKIFTPYVSNSCSIPISSLATFCGSRFSTAHWEAPGHRRPYLSGPCVTMWGCVTTVDFPCRAGAGPASKKYTSMQFYYRSNQMQKCWTLRLPRSL